MAKAAPPRKVGESRDKKESAKPDILVTVDGEKYPIHYSEISAHHTAIVARTSPGLTFAASRYALAAKTGADVHDVAVLVLVSKLQHADAGESFVWADVAELVTYDSDFKILWGDDVPDEETTSPEA